MNKILNIFFAIIPIFINGCGSSTPGTAATSKSFSSTSISSLSSRTAVGNCGVCGDVNLDGTVNTMDALVAAQIAAHSFSPSSCQEISADVDGDGLVTILDALRIADPMFHGQFNCGHTLPPVISGRGTLPVSVSSSSPPNPNQACQNLLLEEPFVSGSIGDNTIQVFNDSGTKLRTFTLQSVTYIKDYLDINAYGLLLYIPNPFWSGGIYHRTAGKAIFQTYPHRVGTNPSGLNPIYAATSDYSLRSDHVSTMNEWSLICGFGEITIGKIYWVNLQGEIRIGKFLDPLY